MIWCGWSEPIVYTVSVCDYDGDGFVIVDCKTDGLFFGWNLIKPREWKALGVRRKCTKESPICVHAGIAYILNTNWRRLSYRESRLVILKMNFVAHVAFLCPLHIAFGCFHTYAIAYIYMHWAYDMGCLFLVRNGLNVWKRNSCV